MRPAASDGDCMSNPAWCVCCLTSPPLIGHRPEVHRAVAIAQEVDPALPQHRRLAGARIVGRERNGFFRAEGERPQVLRRAAAIALGVAALKRQSREDEARAARVIRTVARLGERHERRLAGRRGRRWRAARRAASNGGVSSRAPARVASSRRPAPRPPRTCGAPARRLRWAWCRPPSAPRTPPSRPAYGRRAIPPVATPRRRVSSTAARPRPPVRRATNRLRR